MNVVKGFGVVDSLAVAVEADEVGFAVAAGAVQAEELLMDRKLLHGFDFQCLRLFGDLFGSGRRLSWPENRYIGVNLLDWKLCL